MQQKLTSPSVIRALLEKHSLAVRKQFGQHFLCDEHMLNRIADAAALSKQDTVLEIGPGIGALTQALSVRAGRVVSVEIDHGMERLLADTLAECDNITLVFEDFLQCDMHALYKTHLGGAFTVAANLPYYITTPIIMALLTSGLPIQRQVYLLQREVCERMNAGPGSKAYGALSLAVQYYARTKTLFDVPPGCFYPPPKVHSAVLELTPIPPPVSADRQKLFGLIHAGFAMRRKTLCNNLLSANLAPSREAALGALRQCGLPDDVRAERLNLQDFAALTEKLT